MRAAERAPTPRWSGRSHELPRELGIGHDIVDPDVLRGHTDEIDQYYLDLYEGIERP